MSCHWDWEIEIVKHHLRLEVSYSSSTALVGKTGFMPWTMQLRLREIHSPNYLPLLPPAIALLASKTFVVNILDFLSPVSYNGRQMSSKSS